MRVERELEIVRQGVFRTVCVWFLDENVPGIPGQIFLASMMIDLQTACGLDAASARLLGVASAGASLTAS
jgi:hypothetical protein